MVTEFPVPTTNSLPYLITTGPDGNLWFTEVLGNHFGRITPAGVITEFAPPSASQLRGIKTGPDGNLWFLESNANKIVKVKITDTSDTTPPVITAAADKTSLWPPNGKSVTVTISGSITDTQSGVADGSAAYIVRDSEGTVIPGGGITISAGGRYSFTLLLTASRSGTNKAGRNYTITVRASDRAGNASETAALVTVPHDQGH